METIHARAWAVPLLLLSVSGAPRVSHAQPGSAPAAIRAAGTVRGRVVDADGNQPVNAAQVVVVGTRLGAATNAAGEYVIRGVGAGQVTIRVMRIGYQPSTRAVTVAEGGTAVADFTLARAVTQLEEVVTTATGEQSRREYANVVASVNADSIVGKAPITNVNELLQARTAGVQIIQGSGQTGASSSIRIRGASSLSLTNEPLVVIDGIRYDNSPASGSGFLAVRVNRLNDLNPDEVESIDIIKGPSAAALYGTAAANGVVVVKTKRGRVGRPNWSVYGEGGAVSSPGGFTPNYWSFGRNLDAAGGPIANTNAFNQCRISNAALKRCVVDSATTYNPWTAPETNPFSEAQPRYKTGLQVAGGSETLRYFVSVDRQDERGPYVMPRAEVDRITLERGGVGPRDRELYPNELTQNSVRGNFQLGVRPNLTLDVSSGYARRDLYTPFEGTFFAGMTFQYLTAPGYRTATNGTQREYVGDLFGVEQKLRTDRATSSVALNWTPLSWLTARAVTGLDQSNSVGYRQQLRGEGPRVGLSWGPTGREGGKDFDRSNASIYTVDLGASATWAPNASLSTRTSMGGQWFFNAVYQSQGQGYGLPPGASTPNSARLRQSWEFTTEEKTYGAYIEEHIGWRDLLYLDLSGRTDQNSAFGRSAGNTFYPRAGLSYVVSEESWFPKLPALSRLRLRAAYGKAGVQPSTIAALQFLGAAAFPAGAGADEPGLRLASIGNQTLRPEVTTEVEGGVDLGLLGDRLTIEATLFRKLSKDALYQRPLPPSYGTSIGAAAPTQWENLAAVMNRGAELTVDAQLLRTAPLSWTARVNGSWLKNKLVDAGGVPLPTTPGARNEVGYPLFGLWDRPITGFGDRDNDGVITDDEIDVGPTIAYRGSTLPQREAGLSSTIGLFRDQLQITALLDYRGQFYKRWQYEEWRCQSSGNCRALNDATTPLEDQAAAVAANSSSKRTVWGYFVPNDFLKFRELSAVYTLPERLSRRYTRTRSTRLVVSARNLGYLWTRYPGVDPESNNSVANTGGGNSELTAQPPLRYVTARVNVTF
jgi:TonB-linked SusC/RagA family outer membrane protein